MIGCIIVILVILAFAAGIVVLFYSCNSQKKSVSQVKSNQPKELSSKDTQTEVKEKPQAKPEVPKVDPAQEIIDNIKVKPSNFDKAKDTIDKSKDSDSCF